MKSFIDAVITDMGQKRGVSNASIARIVQNMNHKEVGNRIALAYIKLNNDRATANKAGVAVAVKPEQLLSFVQNVMNQVCWAARRLHIEQMKTDKAVAAGTQAAGIDFSERLAEQVQVEGVSTARIAEIVADDHFYLSNVHGWLASQMDYLTDIEPLEVFINQEQDIDDSTGEVRWVVADRASSFEEALGIMERLVDSIKEEDMAKVGDQAMHLDFMSGQMAPVTRPVPQAEPVVHAARTKVRGPGLIARLFGRAATA